MGKWFAINRDFHTYTKALEVARVNANIGQDTLADKSGTTQSILSRALSGKMKEEGAHRMSEGVWNALAKCGEVLNVPVPTLSEYAVGVGRPQHRAARAQPIAGRSEEPSKKDSPMLIILRQVAKGSMTPESAEQVIRCLE